MGMVLLVGAWLPLAVVLWTKRPYVLDLVSHFALHFVAAELLLGALLLVVGRWRSGGVMLFAGLALGVACGWHFNAPGGGGPADPVGGVRLKIVHYNAFGAISRNDEAFLEWLRAEDPDLVCIIDTPWNWHVTSPWLAERYPYRVVPRAGWAWPNLLLSKHPAEASALVPYSEAVKFSFIARTSLVVEVPGAEPFVFTAFHPQSPRTPRSWQKSMLSAELGGDVLRQWGEAHDGSLIVCADTNSTPMGRLHRTFAQSSGLRGWSAMLGGGTWPAALPRWFSIPIDRIWTSEGVAVRSMEVGPRFVSDHRPIVVEVVVPGTGRDESD